jgi:hypothetical protein
MSDDIRRKAHLLALVEGCDLDAQRFSDEGNDHHAERCKKLAEVYREMAEATS